ncbi:MAG: vWA domain-containing protein [Mycobacterium sp.]
MTFLPVLPAYLLVLFLAVILTVRLVNLYRLLVKANPGQYRRTVLRWTGVTLAGLLLVLAAFRPGLPGSGDAQGATTGDQTRLVSDINLFLVVDRSVTMRVGDYGDQQPRMVGVRDDIAALLEEYRGARVGLIGFATDARVNWPLSQDEFSFRAYAKNLSAYSLTAYDASSYTNPTAAGPVLREQLQTAKDNYPKSKNLVFYFGDGGTGLRANPEPLDVPAELIAGGAVLGYGTEEGGPIPQGFSDGRKTYIGDPVTQTVGMAMINETELQSVAEGLHVPYFHREAGKPITPTLPSVDSSFMSDVVEPPGGNPLVGRTELYWVFALIAAALLLAEAALTVREYRRNRMSRTDFTTEDGLR